MIIIAHLLGFLGLLILVVEIAIKRYRLREAIRRTEAYRRRFETYRRGLETK